MVCFPHRGLYDSNDPAKRSNIRGGISILLKLLINYTA